MTFTEQQATTFAQAANGVIQNLERVIHGKRNVLELVVMALFAEGHVLLEDVPGTGKTTLARSLAESLAGAWRRIQFTPDLLPADVTGSLIYHQGKADFEFHPGAVFANIVLADELNRASPRTQSALLEVMEERQHTVDGETYTMPRPFVVVATQNPIELDGTYRLPEAQLDRFLVRTGLGYLDIATQVEVLASSRNGHQSVEPCIDSPTVRQMIRDAETVHAERSVLDYIARIAEATRTHESVQLGASTRGAFALLRASRVLAAMRGQPFVTPDHVRELSVPVLAHRLLLNADAELRQMGACLLYTSPSPRDATLSRMPSSA